MINITITKIRSYGFEGYCNSDQLTDLQLKGLGLYWTKIKNENIEIKVEGSFEVTDYDLGEHYFEIAISDLCLVVSDENFLYLDETSYNYDYLCYNIVNESSSDLYVDIVSSQIDYVYDSIRDGGY